MTEKQRLARERLKAQIGREIHAHQEGTAGGQTAANAALRIGGRKAHDQHEAKRQFRRATGRLK
jgi:hypothetical protein